MGAEFDRKYPVRLLTHTLVWTPEMSLNLIESMSFISTKRVRAQDSIENQFRVHYALWLSLMKIMPDSSWTHLCSSVIYCLWIIWTVPSCAPIFHCIAIKTQISAIMQQNLTCKRTTIYLITIWMLIHATCIEIYCDFSFCNLTAWFDIIISFHFCNLNWCVLMPPPTDTHTHAHTHKYKHVS